MQKLIIAGNVGKDAVLRRTQSGDPVLGFNLAVDNGKDKNGQKREATWFNCSIWGNRGESLERHITKGLKLTLIGRPTVDVYEGKGKLGISVDDLTFMGGGSDGGNSKQSDSGGYDQGGQSGYGAGGSAMDDEIPFMREDRA